MQKSTDLLDDLENWVDDLILQPDTHTLLGNDDQLHEWNEVIILTLVHCTRLLCLVWSGFIRNILTRI